MAASEPETSEPESSEPAFELLDGAPPVARAAGVVLLVCEPGGGRVALGDALRQAGFTVLLAQGAASALGALDRGAPDAVVVHDGVPDGDGLTLLHRMRLDRLTRELPVLALLASGDAGEALRTLEGGADACLPGSAPPRLVAAQLVALLRRAGRGVTAHGVTAHGVTAGAQE